MILHSWLVQRGSSPLFWDIFLIMTFWFILTLLCRECECECIEWSLIMYYSRLIVSFPLDHQYSVLIMLTRALTLTLSTLMIKREIIWVGRRSTGSYSNQLKTKLVKSSELKIGWVSWRETEQKGNITRPLLTTSSERDHTL